MNLVTERQIIALRDQMTTGQLREITNKTKEKYGYVGYREIFETMGYKYAFNGKYFKPSIVL